MKKTLFIIVTLVLAFSLKAQWTTVDLGNSSETTLFKHTGTLSPVPFNFQKIGYSGNSVSYGLLHLDMAHKTIGGGSNLHFRLHNSSNSFKEYGGIGAYIMDNTSGSEDGALTFYTVFNGQGRTRRMTILNNGNVGVGTESPSAKLDVNGDANFSGKLEHSNKKYFNTLISDNYVKIYQISTNSSQLASNVRISATSHAGNHVGNFTADILVNHYQDVFIRTTSGAYTQGTIKIESDSNGSYFMSYKTTSTNAARYYFTIEALSSELTINTLPTGQAPANTVHEHVSNFGTYESGTGGSLNSIYEGNVGIGTKNTGTHRLAVEGSIGARKVKVEATGWSDFVFENGYRLRPLKEVEKYISENKHLPEIPSAEEVKKDGIDLGQMDSKLLQKIEELTLYLIKQNNQNQAQQGRIEKLEKELKALKDK